MDVEPRVDLTCFDLLSYASLEGWDPGQKEKEAQTTTGA